MRSMTIIINNSLNILAFIIQDKKVECIFNVRIPEIN